MVAKKDAHRDWKPRLASLTIRAVSITSGASVQHTHKTSLHKRGAISRAVDSPTRAVGRTAVRASRPRIARPGTRERRTRNLLPKQNAQGKLLPKMTSQLVHLGKALLIGLFLMQKPKKTLSPEEQDIVLIVLYYHSTMATHHGC